MLMCSMWMPCSLESGNLLFRMNLQVALPCSFGSRKSILPMWTACRSEPPPPQSLAVLHLSFLPKYVQESVAIARCNAVCPIDKRQRLDGACCVCVCVCRRWL